MNTYQVITNRFVNQDIGNVLETIPPLKADYFEIVDTSKDMVPSYAKFWTKNDDDEHQLTAVVMDFLAIVKVEPRKDLDATQQMDLRSAIS